jgi:hypothetical protein
MKKINNPILSKNYNKIVFDHDNLNTNYLNKENNNFYGNEQFEKDDDIPIQLKQKIYNWLLDINILKDKNLKIDLIPKLCINGVLLCDLVNRCEGKNEIIKGIIRRTYTRSHIQVNINKVLEYLRTLEKFPFRHLFDNIEISKGNNYIIWELLDDIYNYYGNKIKFNKNIRNNNNISLNRTFTKPKKSIENKKDNSMVNGINTKKVLNHRNMFTINAFRNENNKYNYNTLNNNKNSRYSYSHTPVINKNKKKKIANNDNICHTNKSNINEKRASKIKQKKNYKSNNMNINNDLKYNFNERKKSTNRNNLNHSKDIIDESKMFSFDDNANVDAKVNNNKNNNIDNTYRKIFDVSSIYGDKVFFNCEKNNKSFSVNNRIKRNNNKYNNENNSRFNLKGNSKSFFLENTEKSIKNKECFLLFEKATANKIKETIGNINKYNTNDLETLDINDYY